MIVVFGATGTIGKPLVDALVAKGADLRAVTGNPENLPSLEAKGCAAVVADFDDQDALVRACEGATKVFLVTPADLNMRRWKANVIDAAVKAGVKHMVMSTGLGASPKARLTFGLWHSESQELLKSSGMDWTLIQPTYFMQNLLWQADSIAKGEYLDDLGGPVSWVDARDIADVAAVALTSEGHAGKAYGLTGPQPVSPEEIAALLGNITIRQRTPDDSRTAMISAGMNPIVTGAMVELSALAPKGYLAGVETSVQNILNRPARNFAGFITEDFPI